MSAIYGTAIRSDGSKVDGTATITTSWNSNYSVPKEGRYRLELGNNPQQKVTVYVDGSTYTEIYVDGDVQVNIQL